MFFSLQAALQLLRVELRLSLIVIKISLTCSDSLLPRNARLMSLLSRRISAGLLCLTIGCCFTASLSAAQPVVVRSVQSGKWSDPATWEQQKLPDSGQSVQVRPDHTVIYDLESPKVLRAIHIGGRLEFSRDVSTRLECGLIKIQPGDDVSEIGFDCEAHLTAPSAGTSRPGLIVGTSQAPIPAGKIALIRLHFIEGMDANSCPAIVSCAGQMEFHGTPLDRTWVKLDHTADPDTNRVVLENAVATWKAGDRVVITGTNPDNAGNNRVTGSVIENPATEERVITSIAQLPAAEAAPVKTALLLDQPLLKEHFAEGRFKAEVANLSRNVVVESAAPDGVRGHTMYHAHSQGSISYAEFRHLGKRDTLGRYSLHFHLAGDTMRGSSVIGASIWDSHNRWLTIHGTNRLIVRDCVGYKSIGHGYFLEDGTEINNVLDGNLAVMALAGKAHQRQVVPFDNNDGAGFWWANCRNAFINNVAAECDEYGYRFEMKKTADFDPVLPIQQPDGSVKKEDTRLITFVRFDNNEAHLQRLFGMNLRGIDRPKGPNDFGVFGAEVAKVPIDYRSIFVIRNLKVWDTRWPFHAGTSGVMVDGFDVFRSTYGVWRSVMDRHGYRRMTTREIHHSDVFMPISVAAPKQAGKEEFEFSHFPGIGTQGGEDWLPPSTVITHVKQEGDKLRVTGAAIDANEIKHVTVNGQPAKSLRDNYALWEIVIDAPAQTASLNLTTGAEDRLGNIEKLPHRARWSAQAGLHNLDLTVPSQAAAR